MRKTRSGIGKLGLGYTAYQTLLNPNMLEISAPSVPIWSGDHSELGDEVWASPAGENIHSELPGPPH